MAEQPISWVTLASGTPLVSSDGAELGRVHEVVADRQKDIFSGVTFRDGIFSDERFVPADLIDAITNERVVLTIPSADAEQQLEPYEG